MLLLVVLSTAAIFSPTFSQPTRTDGVEENDYNLPLYRDRSDMGEPIQRHLDAIERTKEEPTPFKLEKLRLHKRAVKDSIKKSAVKYRGSSLVDKNFYQSSGLDPLGGGHILRREIESNPYSDYNGRRKITLDSLGGGHILAREANLDSLGGGHLLRRENLDSIGGGHLLRRETGLDSIGGGHLLGRDVGLLEKDKKSVKNDDDYRIMDYMLNYLNNEDLPNRYQTLMTLLKYQIDSDESY